MKHLFTFIILTFALHMQAQYLLSMHTEWDDSFKEWRVVVEENDSTIIEGDIDIRWALNDDFQTYDIRIGEYFGEIKQVYANNPSHWQLRLNGELVTMRQTWPSDIREWKISMRGHSFTIQTRFSESYDDWALKGKNLGELNVYSEVIGDVRDWTIDDFMVDDVPFAMRLAAAFVPVMVSSPKL